MATIITILVIWFLISIPVTFFIGAVLGLGKKQVEPQETMMVRDHVVPVGELS